MFIFLYTCFRKRSQASVKREGWAIVAGSVLILAGESVLWKQKDLSKNVTVIKSWPVLPIRQPPFVFLIVQTIIANLQFYLFTIQMII